jgi:periplasmic protein TonB
MVQNTNPAQDEVRQRRPVMLDNCLFESRPDVRNRGQKKPFTLAMSVVVHVFIVTVMILIPLLKTQAVPPVALPPAVQSAGPAVRIVKLAAATSNRTATHSIAPVPRESLTTPTAIPESVAYIQDSIDTGILNDSRFGYLAGGNGLGFPDNSGVPSAVLPPVSALPPQPAAVPLLPPAPKIEPRAPIRVSSLIVRSRLLRQVDPAYPALAKTARIEGAVVVEALITESGTIENLRVISGNPLLIQSVIDAVKQWRYEPTLLNGDPVAVITTITVNFTLNPK